MKKQFQNINFSRESLKIIDTANGILAEYQAQGYVLSLRQLYYQLVARDYIENTVRSYKRIGDIVSNGRLAGLIDWSMIEDRGREAIIPSAWSSPAEIVQAAAKQFRLDRWKGQENYVEVMVEKDALSGILEPICNKWHVRLTANKGYSSSSALYEAGDRIMRALRSTTSTAVLCHVIYLGDHDPSGIDMTRDIAERLQMFARLDDESADLLQVHRVALNMPQVSEWKPPENPAKITDSRFDAYERKFGDKSWELDAVKPDTLAQLVEDEISSLVDGAKMNKILKREKEMRDELLAFAINYSDQE